MYKNSLQEYIQRKNAEKASDKYFSLLFLFCRRIKLVLYTSLWFSMEAGKFEWCKYQ